MDRNMDKTGLSAIRKEIDALDAQMRALLLARARLVEEVARSKAGEPETMPLRPAREMKQMQALADWHAIENPPFGLASLLAVWREIIGAALAQQGGLVVHVCG
ncbi:MAG: chorismate mutase, partial [Pseudomonadota bacterium]|nr:chorismate mutase [Pseudomonadota bacterium]